MASSPRSRSIRIDLDKDVHGVASEKGQVDDAGQEIEDRIYNQTRLRPRHRVPRSGPSSLPSGSARSCTARDPMHKTIVFCEDIDHAERMRQAIDRTIPENARARASRTTAT